MAGEIEKLPLIHATHAIGHDADGFAGRFALAERPVRTTANGTIRRDAAGRERIVQSRFVTVSPTPREVA